MIKIIIKNREYKMSIKSFTIPSVELKYTSEYIATTLWKQKIAKVDCITMIPYLRDNEVFNLAYVYIETWCDSEVAYNFINRLKDSTKETRLVHNSDDWWNIEMNTHNSGNINLYSYTKNFNNDFFEKDNIVIENKNPIYNNSNYNKNILQIEA